MDVKKNLPLSIMICDVNGLKLVNDTYDNTVGDKLLIKIADLIKRGCSEDCIVSRMGGGEFMVALPQTDSNQVRTIIERIKNRMIEEKSCFIDISISFGWATKVMECEDIRLAQKQATNQLYKRKLFEYPSMRSKTIHTIIQTLHEKNIREEAHSRRVSEFCEKMGIALGMSDTEVNELRSVGLLHDIGKIAIDEHILNKPGKLTDIEYAVIKQHPEIGYRILSTVNEMSEMAEYVLAHHERWDGKGYPKCLKKEEIPLQARIIAIADAYDAMTSERSYRNPMNAEVALMEVQRNAGTQFDPFLAMVFADVISARYFKIQSS